MMIILVFYRLKIMYSSTSKRNSFQESVWLRTLTDDCMEGLEKDLYEATLLNFSSVYEHAPGPIDDIILGKGTVFFMVIMYSIF
jgi:hypothetical protein